MNPLGLTPLAALPVTGAFGTTGTMSGTWFLATGESLSLSEQHIVDCSWDYDVNGCWGRQGAGWGQLLHFVGTPCALHVPLKSGAIVQQEIPGGTLVLAQQTAMLPYPQSVCGRLQHSLCAHTTASHHRQVALANPPWTWSRLQEAP